jgi:hypothetical protein
MKVCKNQLFLLVLVLSAQAFCIEIPKGRYKALPDKDYYIPYLSNYPLDKKNESIQHAIIGIHGSGCGTYSIFNCCNKVARNNHCEKHTLVLTPTFLGGFRDIIKDDNLLFWEGRYLSWTWGSGKASVLGSEETLEISTFEIMENIVTDLCQKQFFPNLSSITLTGQSAGGQFVQRFAVFNTVEDEVAKTSGITLRYVPMNPLSYVYLDPKRPVNFKHSEYDIPNHKSSDAIASMKKIARKSDDAGYERMRRIYQGQLSWYNNYGYGLEQLPFWHKSKNLSQEQIQAQYKRRSVRYLIGRNDNSPYRTTHEISAVLLQGRTRLERAKNYYGHLLDVYGETIKGKHKLIVISNAGHGTSGMVLNGIAKNYLLVKYKPPKKTKR